jgi:aminoglycoside/choline kinase family phosphotransferase
MSGERDALKAAFLREAGWGAARIAPLAGDASNRRYDRVAGGAVLMDAPEERGEDVRSFIAMTDFLRGRGLSAPEILHADVARGFLLLEDLGDDLFARVCAADLAREAGLYEAAVDVLAYLAETPPPERIGDFAPPPYDAAMLVREAMLAVEWWLPAATGLAPSPDMLAEFEGLAAAMVAEVAGARDALVLRDYHAENLIWLPGRAGLGRVGLLDYQGAMLGHAAYDLASLLEDARRDTVPELRAAMVARYLAATCAPEEAFRAAYATLAAQRNLKIVGLFARLLRRDGKPGYLDLLPRVWGHLMRDLEHPDLAPVRTFVAAHLPAPEPALLARLREAA